MCGIPHERQLIILHALKSEKNLGLITQLHFQWSLWCRLKVQNTQESDKVENDTEGCDVL